MDVTYLKISTEDSISSIIYKALRQECLSSKIPEIPHATNKWKIVNYHHVCF